MEIKLLFGINPRENFTCLHLKLVDGVRMENSAKLETSVIAGNTLSVKKNSKMRRHRNVT